MAGPAEPTQLPAPPPPPAGPFYRVTEVRANLSERVIQEFPYTDGDLADEQAKRKQAGDLMRAQRDLGVRTRGYSSDSTGKVGPGDLVADSAVNT